MAIVRQFLKRIGAMVSPALEDVVAKLLPYTAKNLDLVNVVNRQNQIRLARLYGRMREGVLPPLSLSEVEFRAYSQNGEDGILLYIFSLIGVEHKRAIEICAGSGIECNTANLVIHHGWESLMVDGDPVNTMQGRSFYRRCRNTFAWPPKLVNAWVTAENVNSIIADNGFGGPIDLLSLDLDGVDYWIWKAISAAQPRVVMVEYNHLWAADRCVSVPYRPDFRATFGPHGADYFGASLSAYTKLAGEKGYRLVGCQRYGFNAFFIRSGIGESLLPAVDPAECLIHPRNKFANAHRLPAVREREWVTI